MQSFLMINSLFKTIEYKLVNLSNLDITELSDSGTQDSKTFTLNSINIEEGQTTPTYLSWLVLSLGVVAIALTVFFSRNSEPLYNNLISTVSFLACTFGALALICKPIKTQIYRDSFSNNILFKLNHYEARNNATKQFVNDLNSAIKHAKEIELDQINLKPNAKSLFETHNRNVDNLLNSGLIDEALYDRVCSSMHEKVFGKSPEQHINNNVIYLNR